MNARFISDSQSARIDKELYRLIYQLRNGSAVLRKIHVEERLVKISMVMIPDRVSHNES